MNGMRLDPETGLRPSVTVGISGGSGALYALRLLAILPHFYERVDVVVSSSARLVVRQECDISIPKSGPWEVPGLESNLAERVIVWEPRNYNAPFASGSNCAEQMVIVPCSMSTVAAIAHGIDQNLMHHAAGVTLKERKDLILVPRETPLSAIHLRNLTTLAELGVAIVPAMPGFYGGQETFDDLINFVLQKIVNQLGLNVRLSKKWGEETVNDE